MTPSTIDLIILGTLLGKPMSAYDLANHIEENRVNLFLKISTPAVYKNCKRLHESGLLDGKIIKKGEHPEKTIYEINQQGVDWFNALMNYFSSNLTTYFLDMNAFIYNIEKTDKQSGIKMLLNLRDALGFLKAWIIQHEKMDLKNANFAAKTIVKQYRMTISALVIWAEETVEEYKQFS